MKERKNTTEFVNKHTHDKNMFHIALSFHDYGKYDGMILTAKRRKLFMRMLKDCGNLVRLR
jgi:hypothetical protein